MLSLLCRLFKTLTGKTPTQAIKDGQRYLDSMGAAKHGAIGGVKKGKAALKLPRMQQLLAGEMDVTRRPFMFCAK